MKRTFLELGGKSALIVTDDVNPAQIMASAVGVCVHAGQAARRPPGCWCIGRCSTTRSTSVTAGVRAWCRSGSGAAADVGRPR